MATVLTSLCVTLVVLAFGQMLVEAVLPEGNMRRYVSFLIGVVVVLATVGLFTRPGALDLDALRQAVSPAVAAAPTAQAAGNPYEEYLTKLIESHRE